jgi:uncharacterized protein (DUF1778 family)
MNDCIVVSTRTLTEMELANENHFVLPPEAWAAFVKALDAPPRVPAGLTHLFSRAPVAESR